MLHQNINFTSISWFHQCKLPIFLACCFYFATEKITYLPICIIFYNVFFHYELEKKIFTLVSGSCQTSFRYELKRILRAYVTLGRFMAAGYFSFYMKHYVNILRWCGIRTSCGIFKALYEIRTTKETQMLSDTDILKIIYSHVLVFV